MNAARLAAPICLAFLAQMPVSVRAETPPELADFDRFMAEQLVRWKVPGASVAVVKDGKVVLLKGYGLRDVERQLPMTADTVQPIASTTKSFTVAALATLVRDGQLAWDEPVREKLPEFRLYSEYATQTVTVRDLLSHRSGLPRHDWTWIGAAPTREQLVARLRHLEPSAEPRARFQYNNLGYVTAGYLGGKLAGSSWETLVQTRLLDPLGMRDTSFSKAGLQAAKESGKGYLLDDDDAVRPDPYLFIDSMGPTGSINSSARDMAQYLLMLTQGGRAGDKVLVEAGDLRAMTTGQIVLPDPRLWPELSNPQYGMGWFVDAYRGHAVAQHGGNLPGAATTLAFLPSQRIGVYATVNNGSSPLRDVIRYAVLDRLLGLPPVPWSDRLFDQFLKGRAAAKAAREQGVAPGKPGTRPNFALADYAGDYEHPGYGPLRIAVVGEALALDYNGLKTPLQHRHFEVFQAPRDASNYLSEQRLQFTSNFDGDLDGLLIQLEPNVKPLRFKRLPDPRFKDAAYLRQLVGAYRIGTTEYNVSLRADNALMLAGRTGAASVLLGLRGHRFEVKGGNGRQIEFLPDAQGRFTKLAVHQGGTSSLAERVTSP